MGRGRRRQQHARASDQASPRPAFSGAPSRRRRPRPAARGGRRPPRLASAPSPSWWPETRGRCVAPPPQTLGRPRAHRGPANSTERRASKHARTRQRANQPRRRGSWAAAHVSSAEQGRWRSIWFGRSSRRGWGGGEVGPAVGSCGRCWGGGAAAEQPC